MHDRAALGHAPGMTFDQLADDLAQGRTTSAALVETAISKAKSAPYVFLTVLEAESRAAAAESDRRRAAGTPLGPLDGIPIAWKDLVDIAGTRTTAGAAIRSEEPLAVADAPVVTATKTLGLIPLGKTHLNEFAFSGIGYNPHFGTPYASRKGGEERAPGGSSAGSAIAVERGIVPGGDRQRYGRLGPHPVRVQRDRRLQDEQRPLSDDRRLSAGEVARHARPDGDHRARLCLARCCDARSRRARQPTRQARQHRLRRNDPRRGRTSKTPSAPTRSRLSSGCAPRASRSSGAR